MPANSFFFNQTPSLALTPEERHAAENVFLQFRRTKQPYNICKQIFGKVFFFFWNQTLVMNDLLILVFVGLWVRF